MELHLKIAGVLLILLALLHPFLPRYFKWKEECCNLSIMNRQILYVHSFFIGFMILMMGLLCMTSSNELLTTSLGKRICLGLGVFWAIRLGVQFFIYSSKVWKGKLFETTMHILFSLLWTYLSIVFFLGYFE